MYETDDQIVVTAEIPGMDSKEDIEVTVRDRSLTLSGEIKRSRDINERGIRHAERYYGRFHRVIPLPEYADTDQAKAAYRNGILEIRMPKKAQAAQEGRRLPIE